MSSFDDRIIAEFRANDGKVGGPFEGAPVVLLTTTGAKSGQRRTTPLVHSTDDGRMHIYASAAGADKHPAWFHNLVANPQVTIEVREDGGIVEREARAEVLEGEARDRIWEAQKQRMPGFADYEAKTDRVIPVIALLTD
jgi:deazaflavin-dependent oxidoreductase (nitroreductase family)